MIKSVARKLNSKKGISIFFALFLILVAFAVGSVVLTAGTVAAGRRNNLTTLDDKYTRVSSAADMLRAKIDGYSVESTLQETVTNVTIRTVEEFEKDDGTKEQRVKITHPDPNPVYSYDGSFGTAFTISGTSDSGESASVSVEDLGIMDYLSYCLLYGGYSSTGTVGEAFDIEILKKGLSSYKSAGFGEYNSGEFGGGAYSDGKPYGKYLLDAKINSSSGDPSEEDVSLNLSSSFSYVMDEYGNLIFHVFSDQAGDKLEGAVCFRAEIIEEPEVLDWSEDTDGETTTEVSTTSKTRSVVWHYDKYVSGEDAKQTFAQYHYGNATN